MDCNEFIETIYRLCHSDPGMIKVNWLASLADHLGIRDPPYSEWHYLLGGVGFEFKLRLRKGR
jgi:hypothetical protein